VGKKGRRKNRQSLPKKKRKEKMFVYYIPSSIETRVDFLFKSPAGAGGEGKEGKSIYCHPCFPDSTNRACRLSFYAVPMRGKEEEGRREGEGGADDRNRRLSLSHPWFLSEILNLILMCRSQERRKKAGLALLCLSIIWEQRNERKKKEKRRRNRGPRGSAQS